MKKIRLTALFMALLLCGTNAAACGADPASGSADTSAADVQTEGQTETTVLTVDIPEKDYGGYEFRVLGKPLTATSNVGSEIYVEEQNGDILNDAVFKRNGMIQDKLNVKITKVEAANPKNDLTNAVMAGDDSFDAVVDVVSLYNASITSGYLLPLSEMKYIDITKPWWTKDVIDDCGIAGKQFLLFGDLLFNDKHMTWCLVFNKEMAAENKLEDPYKMVLDGKWTMDKLQAQCANISQDLNGDTVMDYKDQWGLLGSKTAGIGLVTSCNIVTSEMKNDGINFILDNTHNVNALDKIYDFINGDNMMLRAEDITGVSDIWTEIINVFHEGRALYRISIMTDVPKLRDMEDEFGILPLPKLDENQKEYYTSYQSWNARAYAVPVTVTDPERTGIVLEYMASVSTDTMLKAYYDTTLQRKVARDDESAAMLDIIFNSLTTDTAMMLELGGIRTSIVNMINAASNTNASSIASIKTSVQEQLNTVYENVSKLD